MRDLAKQSFPTDVLEKLAARGWTEEEHKLHLSQYRYFRETLTKLVNDGHSPHSPEAQDLARFLIEMNKHRSQNDPHIWDFPSSVLNLVI